MAETRSIFLCRFSSVCSCKWAGFIERRNTTEDRIIAVCDLSKRYALRLAQVLSDKLKDSFQVVTFTSLEMFEVYQRETPISLLIISESAMAEKTALSGVRDIVILSEEGKYNNQYASINRFQTIEAIMNELICYMSEKTDYDWSAENRKRSWKVLGFYSPVKRVLQTSFAITLGQKLAEKYKVLYVSFENFPVLSGMQTQSMQGDMSDILYFFDCDKEKLKRKLPIMVGKIGEMDYLPPTGAFFDTYDRVGEKWIELFEFLRENTEYDFLLLDLSETVQGLLQVLGYCNRIYTLEKQDAIAKGKLNQYENWIKEHAYADIIDKTMKFSFPEFRDIPRDLSLLTHSELAAYAKAVIKEDLGG